MNNVVIVKSASTKYLGVTISHNLNWNQHCDNICNKANSMLEEEGFCQIVQWMSNLRHILPLCVLNWSMPAQCGIHILNVIFTKSN